MLGQLDLGEVPLADGLEEAVLADVGLLAGAARGDPGRGAAIATLKRNKDQSS